MPRVKRHNPNSHDSCLLAHLRDALGHDHIQINDKSAKSTYLTINSGVCFQSDSQLPRGRRDDDLQPSQKQFFVFQVPCRIQTLQRVATATIPTVTAAAFSV